jgi:endoglucanase
MNQESNAPGRRISATAEAPAATVARAAIVSLAVTAVAVAGCLAAAPPQPAAPAVGSTPASAVAAPPATAVPVVSMAESAGHDRAAGNNLLWNGTFDGEAVRPWSLVFDSVRNGRRVPAPGELCLRVDSGGSHSFDVVLRQSPLGIARGHHYEVRFRTHATAPTRLRAKVAGVGSRAPTYWAGEATSATEAKTFAAPFEAQADDEGAELTIELGGELTGAVPLTVCLDDVALSDPQFEVPIERAERKPLPKVRVNQLGYLPGFAKIATVATGETGPQAWELIDPAGKVHATGKTRPFGDDRSSGDQVQQIDFSSVTTPGKGWKLRVGKAESFPFAIGDDVYHRLKYDALSFFYLQRSGMEIKMPYAGTPAYERPAGHLGDRSVPCAPPAKCTYSLDVSGGWYDAGDHGKYVVSSAISVWTLQNQYEALARFGATSGDFDDGKMNLPEAGNGRPDLLDEARYNLEFMLKMQVPEGQPHAGMAHQRIHGEKWSDLPTMPDKDTIRRFLRPVSTGATYDLAATAAQGARVWRKLDPAFSARCLKAAETAFAAAKKSPTIYAEPMTVGGGAYGDGDLSDELYWAATELFITTGSGTYKDEMTRSRFHASKAPEATGGTLGWDHVAALAKISLVENPNTLGEGAIGEQRQALIAAADRLLGFIEKRGYRVPASSDSAYNWGSNNGVMNGALVLGTAYFLTHDRKYANGVIDCMDYLLGRNPLAKSYVAGYGSNPLRNPHHRVWAHQKDARLPEAPRGAVSGGPNSMLQDPYIRKLGMSGCPPQTCYVDHIESYSTNEVAINWNAPLAWDAAFLDDLARRR